MRRQGPAVTLAGLDDVNNQLVRVRAAGGRRLLCVVLGQPLLGGGACAAVRFDPSTRTFYDVAVRI